jgi:hypothetical protein
MKIKKVFPYVMAKPNIDPDPEGEWTPQIFIDARKKPKMKDGHVLVYVQVLENPKKKPVRRWVLLDLVGTLVALPPAKKP